MVSDHLCECGCGGRTRIAPKTQGDRGYVAGEPFRFLPYHGTRVKTITGYRSRTPVSGGRDVVLHRLMAERALGKPLPKGAVVHHADGSKSEKSTLVICQDQTYHNLLHQRMRVKAKGGNPNTDKICGACKCAKNKSEFYTCVARNDGLHDRCRECEKRLVLERYRRNKRANVAS